MLPQEQAQLPTLTSDLSAPAGPTGLSVSNGSTCRMPWDAPRWLPAHCQEARAAPKLC